MLPSSSRLSPDPRASVLLRLDRAAARLEIAIASLALAASLFVALYTLGARALLVPTAEWVLELPMELLVVASLYGSGALISRQQHLGVDFVVRAMPPRGRAKVSWAIDLGLAALCAFLAERALTAAEQAARTGLTVPELFDFPLSVPLRAAAAAFALWSFHFAVRLLAPRS